MTSSELTLRSFLIFFTVNEHKTIVVLCCCECVCTVEGHEIKINVMELSFFLTTRDYNKRIIIIGCVFCPQILFRLSLFFKSNKKQIK